MTADSSLSPKPRNVPMFEIAGVTLVAITTITMKERMVLIKIKSPMKAAIGGIHTDSPSQLMFLEDL